MFTEIPISEPETGGKPVCPGGVGDRSHRGGTILKRICAMMMSVVLLLLSACGAGETVKEKEGLTVAATTYPVYLLAREVAEGVEGIQVVPVINDQVSCLHDYNLTTANMKVIEGADLILINGVDLEALLADALEGRNTVDCSQGITLLCAEGDEHSEEDADHDHGENDPHIWMDPGRAAQMAENIAAGLAEADPDHAEAYTANGAAVAEELNSLREELREELSDLACRELITFHDGFRYFADAFDLHILTSIEEEEGSEASAQEIAEIVGYVEEYQLPAIFVETNGSDATATAISRECGVEVYTLSMLMSGPEGDDSVTYASFMRENAAVVLEALS